MLKSAGQGVPASLTYHPYASITWIRFQPYIEKALGIISARIMGHPYGANLYF